MADKCRSQQQHLHHQQQDMKTESVVTLAKNYLNTVEIRILPKQSTTNINNYKKKLELKNSTTTSTSTITTTSISTTTRTTGTTTSLYKNYSNSINLSLEPSSSSLSPSSSSKIKRSAFNVTSKNISIYNKENNDCDDVNEDENIKNDLCESQIVIVENINNDNEYNDHKTTELKDDEIGLSSESSEEINQENENIDAMTTQTEQKHELINRDHGNVGIYLETPVVDENICMSVVHEYENAKPKRISDDFFSSDDGDDGPSLISSSCETSSVANVGGDIENMQQNDDNSIENILNNGSSREFLEDDTNSSCSNLMNRLNHDESQEVKVSSALSSDNIINSMKSGDAISSSHPTTSSEPIVTYYDNDVQSMDAIERRDFEHEQRLTGGVIIKTSSLVNSDDKLNLEFLKSYKDSGRRRASSDSKFSVTHKELSTTPTSSRSASVRLTKSTAKINLFATIDSINTKNSSYNDKNEEILPCSSRDSRNLEKSEISSSLLPHQCHRVSKFDVFLNSNSNDSLSSDKSYNTSSNHSLPNFSHKASDEENNRIILKPIKEDQIVEENELSKFSDPLPSTSNSHSSKCKYSNFCYENNKKTTGVQGDISNSIKTVREAISKLVAYVDKRNNPSTSSTSTSTITSSRLNGEICNYNVDGLYQNPSIAGEPVHQMETQNFQEGVVEGSSSHLQMGNEEIENDFDDETWADCEDGSDEEICTCHSNNYGAGSNTPEEDLPSKDVDLSGYIQMVPISEDMFLQDNFSPDMPSVQKKRKLKDGRVVDGDSSFNELTNGRKRMAFDCASTPRSSQTQTVSSPSTPIERRTPRSLIPTKDNPPPELQDWLLQFQRWSHAERILAVDRLIEHCEPTQVRHMMKVIEPQFQRDFISLLPREVALKVLSYLEPKDLLRAAQTCRSWRFLCDDNLLWKEKCRQAQIVAEPKTDRPKRGRAGNMPPISSPWKAAYMRQHIIEMNWRSRPIRRPKVLKGHDDHVITCLQFSGNRIVSGSDDNTLKVWSAITGKCLQTLVGHTGGVWSSQMSGNNIISGSTDRTLKVWNMETGQCIYTLLGHTSTVRCMHLHGKKVVSGSRDATLRVWDIEQGTCLHVLVGHLAAVRCVQYDGKLIVSGAYDYMVKVWHPERQECLHTLQGHTNRVYSLQFDGIHVVSGSLDTSIRVWDAETGNCKHTLMGHQSLTSGMELRQNILVSGNADSTVKVWDITTGQCLQTLSGPNKHQSAVTCLQFNSRFVITSSDDGTVKLWDVKTGEFIRNLVALNSGGSGGVVWRIRANDTKLICAVGSRNGTEETKLMVLDFDVEGACLKCS